jgi:hypothetical protein
MDDRAYLVRFKRADLPPELVIAEAMEFHGEHLSLPEIGWFAGCTDGLGDRRKLV